MKLSELRNSCREAKGRKRVGRGVGSHRGKTSCRGQKGMGARSGYKRRYGTEGGNLPIYMKLPTRGFSNARFQKRPRCINLGQIEQLFEEGDTVNVESLKAHGFFKGTVHGLRILGEGQLAKKVKIEAHHFSSGAQRKLEEAGIEYVQVK